jgi:negative regulator of flagellin synthesis FlgM
VKKGAYLGRLNHNLQKFRGKIFFYSELKLWKLLPINVVRSTKCSKEGGKDMRIEAYNQVQQIYSNNKVNKTQQTKKTSDVRDTVSFSSIGKDIQVAKQAVKATPDVREDLVASLKAAVKNGTYDVSGEAFADKLLAKFEEANGLL